jgi:hypothetical protein
MHPSRCTYCGTLAENPTRLAWGLTDESGAVRVRGAIPLCVRCSALWCTESAADTPVCAEVEEAG